MRDNNLTSPPARRRPLNPSRQSGFSMIETMVVIGVSLILLSLAAPNFGSFIQNNRVKTATEDFVAAVNLARTEAIKRGSAIILCRTGNPGAATASLKCRDPAPDGTPNTTDNWSQGWIMYSKPGYSGSGGGIDYNNATDGAPLLVGNPTPGGVFMRSNGAGNQWLTFFGDGTLNEGGAAALYALCDQRGTEEGRLITIPNVGRPQVSLSPGTCNP